MSKSTYAIEINNETGAEAIIVPAMASTGGGEAGRLLRVNDVEWAAYYRREHYDQESGFAGSVLHYMGIATNGIPAAVSAVQNAHWINCGCPDAQDVAN